MAAWRLCVNGTAAARRVRAGFKRRCGLGIEALPERLRAGTAGVFCGPDDCPGRERRKPGPGLEG